MLKGIDMGIPEVKNSDYSSQFPIISEENTEAKTVSSVIPSDIVERLSTEASSTRSLDQIDVQPEPLKQEVYQAKIREKKLVFQAMQDKSKKVGTKSLNNQVEITSKNLKSMAILRGMIHQKMARENVDQSVIGNINEALKNESSFKGGAKKLATLLSDNGLDEEAAKKIAKEVIAEIAPSNGKPEKHARELAKHTDKIARLLSKENPTEKELKSINKELIFTLRKAFECPAYQALKECEDNPAIHYLHEINLAMYTEVHLASVYSEGKLAEEIVKDEKGNDRFSVGEEQRMGDALHDIRNEAVKKRKLFSSHSCLAYVRKHFKQFFGAFTSQKFGSIFGKYDPHGDLENNAGALYREELSVNGETATALDVRTPSPTIGDKVSPEFRAALQAIENQRVFELKEKGDRGTQLEVGGRPTCWIYTNYQEMTNTSNGEAGRSKAIMQLNKEFPLSFRGLTLSKDSRYFKDGIGHGGSKMWDKVESEGKPLGKEDVEGFVEELKEKLSDDSHFTLEKRTQSKHHGHGIYYPAEKEEMEEVLSAIAKEAGELLKEIIPEGEVLEGKEAWFAKAAAKEFAYAAIQRHFMSKELAALQEQGVSMNVITTSACKEDIDRGFSDHIKRMWMLRAGKKKLLAKITNMPALMARYRVILEDRMQPLVGVMNLVSREKAKEHLNNLSELNGVASEKAKVLGVEES
ncbi:putative uncharacterized protein [Waddlia chondrophila 2032/99]|uniref:Uncharacterized protein n=1 Tax=Waddlia chondrophila 2032/99 TaxID=765953 RepID=F8LAV6_9BACT|nr:putative uncharacterized protein [Waddlia chondrophila 2032/99]